ncbi:retrovirus-related pol polyprotein from transposon TNT 1-94 [Tanacetum coccineum]
MSRTLFRNGKLRESQAKLVNDESKFVTFEQSTNSLKVMLISQRSPSSKGGLGFNKNEASSRGTIQVKFVKPVEVLAGNGSVTKEDGSLSQGSVDLENSQNATKLNFKPTTSFRSDFLIVKKKSIQKANENTIRQPLRLSLKNGMLENLDSNKWIKDSGCSKHMTGNKRCVFSTYKTYAGGNVDFGSNLKGQICDGKCRVLFTENDSEITKDEKVIGKEIRKNDLYVMKLGNKSQDKLCLAKLDDNSTLWHRRLGHANMRLFQSLSSKDLVRMLALELRKVKQECNGHLSCVGLT